MVTTPDKRRGERPLRADDVVVQPAHQRAGVGAGEEGDRHALHVLEHPAAQVEDQALAEAGRLQPLEQADARVEQGDARRSARPEPTTVLGAPSVDDGVDGPAGEHRRGHAEHGRDRGQHEEGDDRAAVGAGERADPAQRVAGSPAAGPPVVLHGALQRHPHVQSSHGVDRLGCSSSLEVKEIRRYPRVHGARAVHRRPQRAHRRRTLRPALLRGRGPHPRRPHRAAASAATTATRIRRVSFIRVAQQVGLSLDEIRDALASLPDSRTPNAAGLGAPVPLVAAPARRPDRHARAPPRPARRLHRLRLPVAAGLPLLNPDDAAGRSGPRPPLRPRRRLTSPGAATALTPPARGNDADPATPTYRGGGGLPQATVPC